MGADNHERRAFILKLTLPLLLIRKLTPPCMTDDGVEHRNVLKSNYYLVTGFVILSITLCVISIF